MEPWLELLSPVSNDEPASLMVELVLELEDDVPEISELRNVWNAGDNNLVAWLTLILKSGLNDGFPQVSPECRDAEWR